MRMRDLQAVDTRVQSNVSVGVGCGATAALCAPLPRLGPLVALHRVGMRVAAALSAATGLVAVREHEASVAVAPGAEPASRRDILHVRLAGCQPHAAWCWVNNKPFGVNHKLAEQEHCLHRLRP
eukprot:6172227-Pleurochrysis_carterae.AAC.3